jgi:hypothetical protein
MSDTLTELRNVAERPWESFRESLWRSFILVLLTVLTLLACRLFHDVDTKTEPGVIMNLPDNIGDYLGFDSGGYSGERARHTPERHRICKEALQRVRFARDNDRNCSQRGSTPEYSSTSGLSGWPGVDYPERGNDSDHLS